MPNSKFPAQTFKPLAQDRFTYISDNYAELWNEIFLELGLDYREYQGRIFAEAARVLGIKEKSILDLSVGDGETSHAFVEAGCCNLTGLDLNPTMLRAAREKYGNKIKLVQGDVRKLSMFVPGQFSIIVSGATIHNITKADRQLVWQEILRLQPELFILGDKIADPDPLKHKQYYDAEVRVVKLVYAERHHLEQVAAEWVKHYEDDERERLELEEIRAGLGLRYEMRLVFEEGMHKILSCRLKSV